MSLHDHRDGAEPAASWRCPACRTVQPETARCWRCDEPAFTCRTCGRYRSSVAADLGYCADDPVRTPLRADETRSCWQAAGGPGSATASGTPVVDTSGLFSEADLGPPPPPALPPPPVRRTAAGRALRTAKPPLEAPGRAAWVEPSVDALVEAPPVEPGKRLSTEVQRRRGRWLR